MLNETPKWCGTPCLYLLLFAALNAHAQPQPHTQTSADVPTHFRNGQAAAANQDFSRAIAEFRAVLAVDPTVLQARANLGLMYYSVGQYDQAAHELTRVVRSDPSLLQGQLFLGLSDLKLGRLEAALQPLQKAAQLDPSNAQAARGLLACYINLAQYSRALAELEFFKSQQTEEAEYLSGQAYLDMGKTLTQRMASKYRDSVWAHQLAGDLAADRGDQKTAADEHAKAGLKDVTLQDIPPAELADSLQKKETAEALYRLIRADTRLGEAYFKKLQDQFPDSAYAHELRGDVYRLRQDFPQALTEFQSALEKREDDAALFRSAAEMDIQLGRLADAQTELQRAAKINPRNPETNYLLGQVYSKSDQTEKAVESLKQALLGGPDLLQARALLGTAYMHLGKPALAAPELEKALPLDYYGDLHFQLYKAYRALGQTASAEKALAVSKQMRERSLHSAVAKITGATE